MTQLDWGIIEYYAMREHKSPGCRPPKIEKRTSLSLRPDEISLAEEQAEKAFNGNVTRYIASLIERDRAGELWMGSTTDPKNERVIEALCRIWSRADLDEMADALTNSSQPKVIKELIHSFSEFLSIWRAIQFRDFWQEAPVERVGAFTVMPQSERDRIRQCIMDCANELVRVFPQGEFDEPLSPEQIKVKRIAECLNALATDSSNPWLMSSKEIWRELGAKQTREQAYKEWLADQINEDDFPPSPDYEPSADS